MCMLIGHELSTLLFRLILIAEKDTVTKKFPTPLINRLEKHFVLTSSILEPWQESLLKKFMEWINKFSDTGRYVCLLSDVGVTHALHHLC